MPLLFIADELLLEEVLVESGTNMSLGCPGLKEQGVKPATTSVEWRCRGQCGASKPSRANSEKVALKFFEGRSTANSDHLSLDEDTLALSFAPVKTSDAGSYTCWMDGRLKGGAAVLLNVLGTSKDPTGRCGRTDRGRKEGKK